MHWNRITQGLVLLLATALSVGCGGGDGDGGGTGTPPGANMTAAELQLAMDALDAINAHRAAQVPPLPAYTWYGNGAGVAYQHCLAMEADNFFAHTDPNSGTTPASRSNNAGITHDPQGSIDPGSGLPFVGENLAYASGAPTVTFTGQQAVNEWIGSPGHHAQLVAPNLAPGAPQAMPAWTHCAIGVRVTTNEIWYTAMFWRNPTP